MLESLKSSKFHLFKHKITSKSKSSRVFIEKFKIAKFLKIVIFACFHFSPTKNNEFITKNFATHTSHYSRQKSTRNSQINSFVHPINDFNLTIWTLGNPNWLFTITSKISVRKILNTGAGTQSNSIFGSTFIQHVSCASLANLVTWWNMSMNFFAVK